jgi:hypothetical protein
MILSALIMAVLMPSQCVADMPKSVNIQGYVYYMGTPADNARVYLLNWDGSRPGDLVSSTSTSDGSINPKGFFKFTSVLYDPAKPFNYCIKADREGDAAYVLVYIIDPYSPNPIVAPIKIDVATESWRGDLSGNVQNMDMYTVPAAKVTLYERDPVNNTTKKLTTIYNPITASDNGDFVFKSMPYGFYRIEAEKNGKMGTEDVVVYKQEVNRIIILNKAVPCPTPTPKPGINLTGGGGIFGIPGFEMVFALAAFLGVAFYLRKKVI